MSQPTCSSCRFYSSNDWSCRRNSPVFVPDTSIVSFPFTDDFEWCGEHKPSTPVVTENLT